MQQRKQQRRRDPNEWWGLKTRLKLSGEQLRSEKVQKQAAFSLQKLGKEARAVLCILTKGDV